MSFKKQHFRAFFLFSSFIMVIFLLVEDYGLVLSWVPLRTGVWSCICVMFVKGPRLALVMHWFNFSSTMGKNIAMFWQTLQLYKQLIASRSAELAAPHSFPPLWKYSDLCPQLRWLHEECLTVKRELWEDNAVFRWHRSFHGCSGSSGSCHWTKRRRERQELEWQHWTERWGSAPPPWV